jgi:hypothetical protein
MPNTDHADARRASKTLALVASCALLLLLAASHATAQGGLAPQQNGFVQRSAPRPAARKGATAAARATVPEETLLQIIEAEDERRWDESDLGRLLADANPAVRRRAALAAGRIGDEGAVVPLVTMLGGDHDDAARALAAFALGEIESESGAVALEEALARSKTPEVRARAIEALGKIAAALPDAKQDARRRLGDVITSALAAEGRAPRPSRAFVLLGLTAVLRS